MQLAQVPCPIRTPNALVNVLVSKDPVLALALLFVHLPAGWSINMDQWTKPDYTSGTVTRGDALV